MYILCSKHWFVCTATGDNYHFFGYVSYDLAEEIYDDVGNQLRGQDAVIEARDITGNDDTPLIP